LLLAFDGQNTVGDLHLDVLFVLDPQAVAVKRHKASRALEPPVVVIYRESRPFRAEQSVTGLVREALMRYKAKSIAALQLAIGGLPNQMRVEVEPDIGVSAKTVAELRKVTVWPENLAITTPLEHDPKSTVKINKVSGATRTSPKP
jgi:hypothetical protein